MPVPSKTDMRASPVPEIRRQVNVSRAACWSAGMEKQTAKRSAPVVTVAPAASRGRTGQFGGPSIRAKARAYGPVG